MVSIKGLDKAEVRKALWDNSHAQGFSMLGYSHDLAVEECREMLNAGQTFFDYVQGRVIKCDLSGDKFDEWGYDRDNGRGAAAKVVEALRELTQEFNEQDATNNKVADDFEDR